MRRRRRRRFECDLRYDTKAGWWGGFDNLGGWEDGRADNRGDVTHISLLAFSGMLLCIFFPELCRHLEEGVDTGLGADGCIVTAGGGLGAVPPVYQYDETAVLMQSVVAEVGRCRAMKDGDDASAAARATPSMRDLPGISSSWHTWLVGESWDGSWRGALKSRLGSIISICSAVVPGSFGTCILVFEVSVHTPCRFVHV